MANGTVQASRDWLASPRSNLLAWWIPQAADERVQAITHCRDTYRVTTADGKTHYFWGRNLRFKTDVGDDGPRKGAPAIVAAGTMGDRADVIFAAPEEISGFIAQKC